MKEGRKREAAWDGNSLNSPMLPLDCFPAARPGWKFANDPPEQAQYSFQKVSGFRVHGLTFPMSG
jgi:hypothetical protein